MTLNPNADVSGNKARRGRKTAAVAGGSVVGVGGIIALVVALLTGGSFDLGALLGDDSGTQQSQSDGGDTVLAKCDTGADANADDSCRIAATSLAIDQFWERNVESYREPSLTIVEGRQATPCGTASNAVGPFYCPADQGVYLDPTFFQLMRQQFGASAGELAQVYVLAHEYGHHVQNLTGTMRKHPNNGTGPKSNGVRTELQADCFAGAFIKDMTKQTDPNGVPYFIAPTDQQIKDALNAASAVGDDSIQKQAGVVNPESWTHGSSASRQKWFMTGHDFGIGHCDTFAPGADV